MCELIQQSWTFPLIAYAATLVVMGVIALVALATDRHYAGKTRESAGKSRARYGGRAPAWWQVSRYRNVTITTGAGH
jgi:hypothetical protein